MKVIKRLLVLGTLILLGTALIFGTVLIVKTGKIFVVESREENYSECVCFTRRSIMWIQGCVEQFRQAKGTIPLNQDELVNSIGPLPKTAWGSKISYERIDTTHYRISCVTEGVMGMIYEYRSDQPLNGVKRTPF